MWDLVRRVVWCGVVGRQDRGTPAVFRRPRRQLVSSPATPREDDSQDRYTNDSFCVGDETVEYASDAEAVDQTL